MKKEIGFLEEYFLQREAEANWFADGPIAKAKHNLPLTGEPQVKQQLYEQSHRFITHLTGSSCLGFASGDH